uniref:hypothetical protein n=1 Tax=Heyndrickxia coagulans TaxID=1398 RepID=UPI00159ED0E0|nr:hypothetical protein [Heyndrickxia coagulans]
MYKIISDKYSLEDTAMNNAGKEPVFKTIEEAQAHLETLKQFLPQGNFKIVKIK